MNRREILAIPVLIFCFVLGVYPQYAPTADQMRVREEIRRQQEAQDIRRRSRVLDNLRNNGISIKRTVIVKKTLSEVEKEQRKKIAAPSAEDLELSKEFLSQPNTGIFRLFPDEECLEKGVVKVGGKCEGIFPGTWFFSFREKDYSDDLAFDIALKNGKLITDGFLSQGILVKLGNFSLDRVTPDSSGAKFLTSLKPLVKAAEIKKQYEEFGRGVESDGFVYTREARAETGAVYLLRVIAYRLQKKFLDKNINNLDTATAAHFARLEADDRKDITVAFRIIRKSKNGDLTILWKELARTKSPELIFSN